MIHHTGPHDKDLVWFGNNASNVLGLLEPQILEAADRLGIKLVLLKVFMFSDSAESRSSWDLDRATKS